ncbi:MAG: hypothetical protein ACKPKO_02225, partial [Candidatus Fonsibacter sp.]
IKRKYNDQIDEYMFMDEQLDEPPDEPKGEPKEEPKDEPQDEPEQPTQHIEPTNCIMNHIKNIPRDIIVNIIDYMLGTLIRINPLTDDITIRDVPLQYTQFKYYKLRIGKDGYAYAFTVNDSIIPDIDIIKQLNMKYIVSQIWRTASGQGYEFMIDFVKTKYIN